jgi:hypothetical protein
VVLSIGNPEIYAENSLCSEEGTLCLHQQNKSKRSAGLQRGVDLHVWGGKSQWHGALMHYQKILKVLIKYYGTNDYLMVAKTHEKIGMVHVALQSLHLTFESFE